MADDRFAHYNPAPLDQSGVGRFARSTAGAAESGVKGALAGIGTFAAIVGTVVAGGMLLGGASVLAAAGWFAVAATASVIAGATIGLPLFAAFGVTGGVIGAFRGFRQESQQASLDQSYYNAVVAEATARGAAHGQAMAYMGNQPKPGTMPQPNVTPVQTVGDEVLAVRRDTPGLPTMNRADSTVVAKDSVSHEGKQEVTLSKADQVLAAANSNRGPVAQAI